MAAAIITQFYVELQPNYGITYPSDFPCPHPQTSYHCASNDTPIKSVANVWWIGGRKLRVCFSSVIGRRAGFLLCTYHISVIVEPTLPLIVVLRWMKLESVTPCSNSKSFECENVTALILCDVSLWAVAFVVLLTMSHWRVSSSWITTSCAGVNFKECERVRIKPIKDI